MARRNLSNNALWGFEFVYARLLEVESQLEAIVNDNTMPRLAINKRIQMARISALKARERVIEVHPNAPRRSISR